MRCSGRLRSLPFSLTPSLRYDDGTKDESALPFHIHLSLALKQLIGTSADDDDWNEEDSDYLGPTPKWFYSFYDDGAWFPSPRLGIHRIVLTGSFLSRTLL